GLDRALLDFRIKPAGGLGLRDVNPTVSGLHQQGVIDGQPGNGL
ncbi:MAG: hypothetical protein RI937_232, partial [Pseudomonadota bacterium]